MSTPEKRYVGQVKWFNNKAGYGFITMSGSNKDIFIHYSTVKVDDAQYKYLIQGEYVEFELCSSANEAHEFQATNVTGIQGGKLMCETRQKPTYRRTDEVSKHRKK
jgi:CspA family cold shock protein